MNALFTIVSLKIALLCGGVGVLLYQIYDPESMLVACWWIGWFGFIIANVVWITYTGCFAIAFAPKTVFSAALQVRAFAFESLPFLAPLPPGEQTEALAPGITLGDDILIRFESPDETPAEFAAKGRAALQVKNLKVCILALAWGQQYGMIVWPDKTEQPLDRTKLPWQKPEDWTDVNRDYPTEPFGDYEADLRAICDGWKGWIVGAKIAHAQVGKKATDYFDTFSRATILILCLFSAQLSAQPKSVQVAQYLGAQRLALRPTGEVAFKFEKLELTRNANGNKTFAQVLEDGRVYVDADNLGPLEWVKVNGKVWPRQAQPKMEPAMPADDSRAAIKKFMRPHVDTTVRIASAETESPMAWAMDSVSMSQKMNDAKDKLMGLARPVWDSIMMGVDVFYYILLYFMGISRFVSITCNNETRINAWGQRVYGRHVGDLGDLATFATFLISLFILIVFLTNIYIRSAMGNLSGIFAAFFGAKAWFAYGWIFILWIAARALDRWVPNPRIISGGNPHNPRITSGK